MEVQSKVMNLDNISTDLQSTDEDTVKDALIALNGFQNIEVEKVCLQSSRYFKHINNIPTQIFLDLEKEI